MNPTITIRPTFNVKGLKKLVIDELHYKSVNLFVEQAILEKAQREVGNGAETEKVLSEIRQVLNKHDAWTFRKSNTKEDAAIRKSRIAVESGKEKTVSADVILKMLRS